MSVIITKIPKWILRDAARNMGWAADDYEDDYNPADDPIEPYLEKMEGMSGIQIFEKYCTWQGLIGYGESLWDAVEALQMAEE